MHRVLPFFTRSHLQWGLAIFCLSGLLLTPFKGLAHAGHGDHEFEASGTAVTAESVRVDPATSARMGIRVQSVARQRFAQGLKTTGQIETLPNQQVKVTAPLTGTVVKLLTKPGNRVRQGQVLAILSSAELAGLRSEALDRRTAAQGAIQAARADLRLAQRNYDRQVQIANAAVQQAQTKLKVAQERYNRDSQLLAQGAIPSRTVLESEAELSEAKAQLIEAKSRITVSETAAQLERAKSAVQVAQSQLQLSDDAYQTRLRQLQGQPNQHGLVTVVAPIAGTIAEQTITPGESVNEPGVPLMTIVNGTGVWATANVYEKDLPRVSKGQRVRVGITGLKGTFAGTISYIGTAVQGETRIIPVRAALNNGQGLLKPGMFAELEILTGQAAQTVLAVTTAAVVNANGRSLVYVKNGQNYEPIEVALGEVDGDRTEIKSGLFEGDQVVVQGAPLLYAQSLRGGGAKQGTAAAEAGAGSIQSAMLPWWAIGGSGAIAISTFCAGMVWANYRHRKDKTPLPTSSSGSLNHTSNGSSQGEESAEQFIEQVAEHLVEQPVEISQPHH
jgi:membrane fusion protein, heavy metal efflux system